MTQRFVLHPDTPQQRLLRQAAQVLRDGGVIALPTDACYVLACQLDDKGAVDRLRTLRGLDDKHLLTLMCRDLSELSVYAQVDNRQYRFLREWTPQILPPERHQGYALQWFTFALAALVIFLVLHWRRVQPEST